MPFCYAPWTNIDIDPQGSMTPCCKFEKQYYNQQYKIQTHSLTEYSNSKLINDVKQDFLEDRWPIGCERCQIEELNKVKSKRQLDYERWKEYYDSYDLDDNKFITTSVAFGNTCNLKCIICSSHASSKWQKEYYELYGEDIPHFKFYKKNFVQDFIKQAPDIVHIDLSGGEPFLSGITEQKDLLSHYIDVGQAKNITLHYTTNVQIFPDKEWWELWSHFKEVEIQLSIDGINDRYEYLRYPAKWSILIENLNKYLKITLPNFKLSVSHTISAYNVYYLDEFFTWCYNVGLPSPWVGRVHVPQLMRPEIWIEVAKHEIVEKLKTSKHPDVQSWANLINAVDLSTAFGEFKNKLLMHDEYRKTNFKNTFPELAKYI